MRVGANSLKQSCWTGTRHIHWYSHERESPAGELAGAETVRDGGNIVDLEVTVTPIHSPLRSPCPLLLTCARPFTIAPRRPNPHTSGINARTGHEWVLGLCPVDCSLRVFVLMAVAVVPSVFPAARAARAEVMQARRSE